MIYFRRARFPVESKEKTEQLLYQSTSRILTFFELAQTNAYVIPEGRAFVGKRLETGDVLISRYRHIIFGLVPRIVTKWKIESINGESHLVTQTRLSLIPTILLLNLSLALLVRIAKSIINYQMLDVETFLGPLIIAGLLILLIKYEIAITDKIIKKVVKGESVKIAITA